MPARGGGGGGSGGGVFVLVHRNVAMESLVGMRASPYKEERTAEEDEKGSESSSIGADEESSVSLSSSSEGVDQDEAQSKLREEDDDDDEEEDLGEVVDESALGSLEDLEDALPIKRGLSNYFSGKAKSFSSLADIVTAPTTVADLAKQEHPFNKRRRVLMAAKKRAAWPRRASCSSLNTLPMPSLLESELRVLEEEDEEEDRDSRGESPRHLPPLPPLPGRGLKSFRAPRSFSLVDLQQHDQQHDEFC